MPDVTGADAARELDVPPETLRRWVRSGIVPLDGGKWSPSAIAQARIVARLRERGHTMRYIRDAVPPSPAPLRRAARRRPHGGRGRLGPRPPARRERVRRPRRLHAEGEVLVTRPVVEAAGEHLRFEQIGAVTMKGFSEPIELFVASQAGP